MNNANIILHLTTVPQSLYGFFNGQFRYLREKGFNIHAASSPGELFKEFSSRENVPVYEIEMTRGINLVSDLVSLFKLLSLLRRLRPVIVHAHTPKAGLLAMMSAFILRVPCRIYHVHGLPLMTSTGPKRTLLLFTEWLACHLATRVYAVSRSLAAYLVNQHLCPRRKLSTIANGSINGIDALQMFNPARFDDDDVLKIREMYRVPAGHFVFGFVGRITHDKGIVELVEAWRLVSEECDKVELLIVGPIEHDHGLTSEVMDFLRHTSNIKMTGRVLDIAPVYTILDTLVFPTYREGFGLAAVEASAMMVPVIATRVIGCVDAVVDDVTGVLIPPGDPLALAEAMKVYYRDELLRRKHGEAGRRRVLAEFAQQPIWETLCNDYDEILSGHVRVKRRAR